MNSWSLWFLGSLALFLPPGSGAEAEYAYEEIPEDIDPDRIVMNISKTEHGVAVSWTIPYNHSDPGCYLTELQYKSQCVKDWKKGQTIQLYQKDDVDSLNLNLSLTMNYDFRIRIKLDCMEKEWSDWTKVQSWGNNTGACVVESSDFILSNFLVIVLPLTAFLLLCLLILQRIRKVILPEVPDPKHLKNKIMDTEQFQWWWGNLTHRNEECTTTDIEIIDKSESEEQHQTLVIQPTDTIPEQHDSMYCIYSSETPGVNTDLQYSKSVLGYIAL